VGFDTRRQTLLFHDPERVSLGEYLFEMLEESENPFGVECNIILTPKQSLDQISGITLLNKEFWDAYDQGIGVFEKEDTHTWDTWFNDLPSLQPHFTAFLSGLYHLTKGDFASAHEQVDKLIRDYPKNHLIQNLYLQVIEASPDRTHMCQSLKCVVEDLPLHKLDEHEQHFFPSPYFFARYSDFLRFTPNGQDQAFKVLERGVLWFEKDGQLLNALGEWYFEANQRDIACFLFRLSSALEPENEFVAYRYSELLSDLGDTPSATEFLYDRTQSICNQVGGHLPWQTLIRFLSSTGQPEKTRNALLQVFKQTPEDPYFARFLISTCIEEGLPSMAWTILQNLKKQNEASYPIAKVAYDDMIGRPDKALNRLRALKDDRGLLPTSLDLFTKEYHLMEQVEGILAQRKYLDDHAEAMLENASWWEADLSWIKKNRAHDYHSAVKNFIEKFPYNRWAARELAWEDLYHLEKNCGNQKDNQHKTLKSLDHAIAMGGYDAIVLSLRARKATLEEDQHLALQLFLEAIRLEPGYSFALSQIESLVETKPPEAFQDILKIISNQVIHFRGLASGAHLIADFIATRTGFSKARDMVAEWMKAKPSDPSILFAWFELQFNHSQGREVLKPLLKDLERNSQRFPGFHGFSLLRIDCLLKLNEIQQARSLCRKLIVQSPGSFPARSKLVQIEWQLGHYHKAIDLARISVRNAPANIQARSMLGYYLKEDKQLDNAMQVLEIGLQMQPGSLQLTRELSELYAINGDDRNKLKIARELVKHQPNLPEAHLFLAEEMEVNPEGGSFEEVQKQYQKACNLDLTEFTTHWGYASFLAKNKKFKEARGCLEEHLPNSFDPVAVKGCLCMVTYEGGHTEAAIQDLNAVLEQHPYYIYGWRRFIHWALVSSSPGRFRDFIYSMNDIGLQDLNLQVARFKYLVSIDDPYQLLTQEWQFLHQAFPDHIGLFFIWAEVLYHNEGSQHAQDFIDQWPDHDTVEWLIEAIDFYNKHGIQGNEKLLLALLQHKEKELAGMGLQWLLFERSQSNWVRNSLKKDILTAHKGGVSLSSNLLETLFEYAAAMNWIDELAKWANHLKFDESNTYLYHRALVELASCGSGNIVMAHERDQKERFSRDTLLWVAKGYAYVKLNRFSEAIEHLKSWKRRIEDGLPSWILANLVLAMVISRKFAQAVSTTDQAFEVNCLHPKFVEPNNADFLHTYQAISLISMGQIGSFSRHWSSVRHRLFSIDEKAKILNSLWEITTLPSDQRENEWVFFSQWYRKQHSSEILDIAIIEFKKYYQFEDLPMRDHFEVQKDSIILSYFIKISLLFWILVYLLWGRD
jgi:predicted Zn-dependent protease